MAGALRSRWDAFAGETAASLRESPGLRLLLFTTLLTSFLAGLLIPVLPLFLIDRGFNLFQLGGLFSLVAAVTILVQLASARHGRFFGRHDVVLALQGVTVLAFPAYLFLQSPLEFLAVTALTSVATAASAPGLQLLLAEAAPVRRRAALFGYFGMLASLAYAAAVVVGFTLSAYGYAWVLYMGTVLSLLSFLVSAGVLLRARLLAMPAGAPPPAEVQAALEASRAALGDLRAWQGSLVRARSRLEALQPRLLQATLNVRWLTLHLFFFGISTAIYPVYFPLHLEHLGLPRAWGGVVIAASWVTFALCQPLGARWADRTGKHRMLIVASLLVAAALNLVMATQALPWVVAAWVLLGIADGLGRPVTSALITSSVTRAGRGSAFAWTQAGTTTARIVAPYALAFAIAGGGIAQGLLLVTGTILLAAFPVAWVKDLRVPAAPRPAAAGGAA
jgi:MFS family permease